MSFNEFKPKERVSERARLSAQRQAKKLFGIIVTNICMALVLSRGGKIQITKLTEHFGFDEFLENHKQLADRLFTIEFK